MNMKRCSPVVHVELFMAAGWIRANRRVGWGLPLSWDGWSKWFLHLPAPPISASRQIIFQTITSHSGKSSDAPHQKH